MTGRWAGEGAEPRGGRGEPDHPWLLPSGLLANGDLQSAALRTPRDWLVDWLVFAFAIAGGVGVIALTTYNGQVPGEGPEFVAECVMVGVSALAVWLRRRWPVQLAVVLGLVSAISVGAVVASMISLFTVAVHRRFAVTAWVTGLHIVTALPANLLRPDPTSSLQESLAWAAVFTAAITAWGLFVRARRQLVYALRDRVARSEAEQLLRVAQARHLERERIAREMHDVLAHRMSLLSLHAGALEYHRDASPEIAKAAGVIRSTAHQALEDLRGVIGVLRAGDLTGDGPPAERRPERPQPTLADLPALVEESRLAGMRVTLEENLEDPASVPEALGRNAYRIVQEGLTNARKHAPGCTAEVAVRGAPGDGLSVTVANRLPAGGGPSRQGGVEAVREARAGRPESGDVPGAGAGLVGLAERAELAGGRLEHGPTADGDFRLRAWLPWR